MADITSSLFPEIGSLFNKQYLGAQQAGQNAAAYGMGTPLQAAMSSGMALAGQGGYMLGSGVGRALGGTTPEEQQVAKVKSIADQITASGKDLQSAEGMTLLAQELNKQGDYNSAQKAMAAANILKDKEASIGLQTAQTAKLTQIAKQEADFKRELEALGPNATQEQIAGVAIKYSSPEKAAQIMQASADKAATRELAKTTAAEKIETAKEKQKSDQEFKMQMANLNASLRGSNNDLQKQMIQARIDDLKSKQEDKAAAQANVEQGTLASFDTAIQTADLIKNHPGKSDVVGSIIGKARAAIPGTDAAGFVEQLETMKAQTFLPQVKALKGMGSLSNDEGKKLTAAVGALSINMKQKEFDESLNRIVNTLNDAKQRAISTSRYLPKEAPSAAASKQAPVANQAYADAEKERRYQEFKKSQGR